MGNVPDDVDLNPKKIALGCVTPEERDGVLLCDPKLEHNGKQIPLTEDAPVAIEKVDRSGNSWRIVEGGTDMTLERQEAFTKALKKGTLKNR